MLQVRAAAQRTVALLSNEVHGEAAFDAALLTRHPSGAAFDSWWRVEIPAPDAASAKLPGSILEQPLHRCATWTCRLTDSRAVPAQSTGRPRLHTLLGLIHC